MARRTLAACFVALVGWSAAAAQTPAEYKDLEKMVVKALEAYNKDDAKGVFADWEATVRSQDATQMFNALFKPNKTTFGKYKSHTFEKERARKEEDGAEIVLLAQFEKKKAQLFCIFGVEEGKMKLRQISFLEAP